ncbi:hypothetical protein FO519_001561 [Halicephalobus sp. NKZ332]|nr:hypothetical protein FO519_001561 [Halicephalobus sp. NKZ332]
MFFFFIVLLSLSITPSEGTFSTCCGCPPPFGTPCSSGVARSSYQTQYAQPAQYVQPAQVAQPAQYVQPAQVAQPAQYVQPVQVPQPDQYVQPAQVPQFAQDIQPPQASLPSQFSHPVPPIQIRRPESAFGRFRGPGVFVEGGFPEIFEGPRDAFGRFRSRGFVSDYYDQPNTREFYQGSNFQDYYQDTEAQEYYEEPEVIIIVKKPPPSKDPCYINSSGFRCCNTDLEGTMHGAYKQLKSAPDFNDCNIGLMSKVVQKAAQRRFRLSFETIVSLKPFGANSIYDGNYTCRFEKDGKYFLSYATPVQYDVGDAKSEDALSNADSTHDDEDTTGSGEVRDASEKQAKVDKLNAGLKDVKSTGVQIHERVRRAVEMDHESYFIEGDEFIAFKKLNDSGRENKFITDDDVAWQTRKGSLFNPDGTAGFRESRGRRFLAWDLQESNEMIDLINRNRSFFRLSSDAAMRLVDEVDSNGDRQIDFREFSILMLKARNERMRELTVRMGTSVLPKYKRQEATDYLLEYSCWPPPLFVVFAAILEIIFYFYYAFDHGYGIAPNAPAPTWSPLILNPRHKEWIWTYFSYTLIHVGYMHLVSNLVMQLILGISLELVHKGLRIGSLFLLGAFTGALLFWVFDPHVYLAGASGGVYALLTAHLADVLLNWSEMPFRWIRVGIFGVFITADFGYAAYERFIAKADIKIAVTAHIGGAVTGALLGIVLLRNLENHKWEDYVWYAALLAYVLFNLVLIVLIIAPPLF